MLLARVRNYSINSILFSWHLYFVAMGNNGKCKSKQLARKEEFWFRMKSSRSKKFLNYLIKMSRQVLFSFEFDWL